MNIDASILDIIRVSVEESMQQVADDIKQDSLEIMNEINEVYFQEANKVYDSFIKQYYEYETKSYIRHWESKPGTKKGTNLYYGKNFKIHKGLDPYFELEISSDEMADDYEHDSAFDVLYRTVQGYNFISGMENSVLWERSWTGKYSSRYFKYKGTLEGALETFLDTYIDNTTPMFQRRMRQRGWI